MVSKYLWSLAKTGDDHTRLAAPGDSNCVTGVTQVMHVELVVQSGRDRGKRVSVEHDKFVVGRSETADLTIDSSSVSRKHCCVRIKHGSIRVQDLKSRNGTYLNDRRLSPSKVYPLASEDVLTLGKIRVQILVPDAGGMSSDDLDLSSWTDDIDMLMGSGHETVQISSRDIEKFAPEPAEETTEESSEASTAARGPQDDDGNGGNDGAKAGKEEKGAAKTEPGKLKRDKRPTANSKEAAQEALRDFFHG